MTATTLAPASRTADRMDAAAFAAARADHYIAAAKHASDVEQDLRAEAEHLAAARYWMRIWSSHWAA